MIYEVEKHLWRNRYFVQRHTGQVDEDSNYIGYDWVARELIKSKADEFAEECRSGKYSEEQIQEMIDSLKKEME